MAENNRKYSIFLLVLALIGAVVFYGCGGSSSSDPVPAIEYQITGSYTSNGLTSAVATSGRASSGLAEGILIYSEADPTNYADIDTAKRTYIIKNLKPGKHYIVFKHIPNNLGGTTYICRTSNPVVLTADNPVQTSEKLHAEECTVSITGKITNPNGTPIVPAPVLTLWGQNIEVNTLTGEFTTPKMPEKTKADLIVNAVNYQQTSSPIIFESNPAYFEITAVDTSSNNVPPTINLSSKKSVYNTNANVTFTAVASDLNKDELEFNWQIESCTAANPGFLEKGNETHDAATYTSECYWSAPADDCIATISVTVFEKNTTQKLSAKAKLKIQIGTGQFRPNTVPVITSTEIYPENLYGDRTYTVTCNATDTDGDILTEFLTISPSGGKLDKSGMNTWSWRTPDLDTEKTYTFTFEVRDPRGNKVNATKTVTVQPSQPNQPPTIVSATPAGASNVMSGTTLDMLVEANDPENEKLTFKWEVKKGELVSTSKNNNIASATWKAPFLNADTPTSISCSVKDPYGAEASLTFDITINPDPNRKAPEIDLSISGTTAQYNGMLLFKPEEVARFTGAATDSNSHVAIDESHYTWYLTKPNSSEFEKIETGSNNTSFTIPQSPERGNYTVKMTATDLSNITGENSLDFRVNSLPTVNILFKDSLGNFATVAPDGRLRYSDNSNVTPFVLNNVDVFNYNAETVATFVASCTDIETESSILETNAVWILGSTSLVNKQCEVALTNTGLNKIELTTIDSKFESPLATASYQFYINKAPVFGVATSSKTNYVDLDTVRVEVTVTDDFTGMKMAAYLATRASGEDFSPYSLIDWPTFPSQPINIDGNSYTNHFDIKVTQLRTLFPGKDEFKIVFIATDSMGLETRSDLDQFIEFKVQAPHSLENIKVASGSYDPKLDTDFASLEELSEPYIFEAKQKFSIKSGCIPADQQGQIDWAWYDAQWNGNNIGGYSTIDEGYCDGYTLNGYNIEDKFGTHTIKLEGKHKNTNVIASKTVNIFINSTPQVSFNKSASGTMRFDTGAGATFTISLKEDNKDEKLGLLWTIEDLNRNCEPVATHTILSNSVNTNAVYMNGQKERTITMTWDDITHGTLELASGAKRIHVMAYDAYGKAATATVDILVNRLPEFVPVVGERLVSIVVPNNPDDSLEDYTYFKEQYATTTANVPIYLVAGNPSMQFIFSADATDYEYGDFPADSDRIIWRYTDEKGKPMTKTGKTIRGRFGIGSNTVNVEIRDFFYDYYSKDGDNTVYNDMCVATCSEEFYLWQSMAWNMTNVADGAFNENSLTANALYSTGENHFFISYKEGNVENQPTVVEGASLASFSSYYELSAGVNTDCFPVDNAFNYPCMENLDRKVENGVVSYPSTDPPSYSLLDSGIITLLQKSENEMYMLLDSHYSVTAKYFKYYDTLKDAEYDPPYNCIFDYLLFKLENHEDFSLEKMATNKRYFEFGTHVLPFPGNDNDYVRKILSMTYCDTTDPTAGAMLLKKWSKNGGTGKDVLTSYKNDRLWFMDQENVNPLYGVDGTDLSLTGDSKVRFLAKLGDSINQKLFVTDTKNNRLIRCSAAFTDATSITASNPIDVCTTDSKYVFSLSGSNDDEKGITLYAIDNASATPLTYFAKHITEADVSSVPADDRFNFRAGKVLNPKSIIYYTLQNGDNYFGGLLILEKGMGTNKNRIQLIRSNKADWLE